MSGGTLILPDGQVGTDLKMGPDGPYFGFDGAAEGQYGPTVKNISVSIANTEIEYALPAGARSFAIKSRSGRMFRLAFASGNTGTEYLTVRNVFANPSISATQPLSLFFSCDVAGEIVEIVSWL